jgi:hypothetical protein
MDSKQRTASLDSVLTAFGIPESAPIIAPYWERSMASLPEDIPPFLAPESISQMRRLARLPQEADSVLHSLARQITVSQTLLQFAWHCQLLLCEYLDYDIAMIRQWPELNAALGKTPAHSTC